MLLLLLLFAVGFGLLLWFLSRPARGPDGVVQPRAPTLLDQVLPGTLPVSHPYPYGDRPDGRSSALRPRSSLSRPRVHGLSARAAVAIDATSSGESAMRRAAQFSSRCSSELVPGIGSITGERARSQASAICAGEARCFAATAATQRRLLLADVADARAGRTAGRRCPCACTASSTASGASTSEWVILAIAPPPPETLNMFCTATIGVRASACSSSRAPTLLSAEVADLALGLQRDQRVERLEERHRRGLAM